MSSTEEKKFILVSSDDMKFEVDEGVAMQSGTIAKMVEKEPTIVTIPLPDVNGTNLAKVVDYCKMHAAVDSINDANLKEWDSAFVDVHHTVLCSLLMAAHYLDIKNLVELGCQKAADMITGKSPEEILQTFDLKSDLTPEEQAAIREEFSWAFDN